MEFSFGKAWKTQFTDVTLKRKVLLNTLKQQQTMQNDILQYADDPVQLERLYRSNKSGFQEAFDSLYPSLMNKPLAGFWQARLHPSQHPVAARDHLAWGLVILLGLVAAFLAKVPAIFSINEEFYLSRFIGFIVFPVLAVYFIWRNGLSNRKKIIASAAMLAGLLWIAFLPDNKESDTLILACIHLPLFLWSVLGFVFIGDKETMGARLDYLKFNGDLVVMTALIGLAFGLMSGVTMGLFDIIGLNIQETYMEWVALSCIAAAPVIATHLTRSNPQLVGRVSPVIAKIFSPLVLVMLVIYLTVIAVAGKSPFEDRNFLLIFNALLIGVMAILFFAVSDKEREKTKAERWILMMLTLVTIVVNIVAISAIVFRTLEWGMTPNRAAVLGANLLIFTNLSFIAYHWIKVLRNEEPVAEIGNQIGKFLPYYFVWSAVVTFLFPVLFR